MHGTFFLASRASVSHNTNDAAGDADEGAALKEEEMEIEEMRNKLQGVLGALTTLEKLVRQETFSQEIEEKFKEIRSLLEEIGKSEQKIADVTFLENGMTLTINGVQTDMQRKKPWEVLVFLARNGVSHVRGTRETGSTGLYGDLPPGVHTTKTFIEWLKGLT